MCYEIKKKHGSSSIDAINLIKLTNLGEFTPDSIKALGMKTSLGREQQKGSPIS